MKKKVLFTLLLHVALLTPLLAQEESAEASKMSYYEKRAQEDALYEQSLALEEEEEADFWADQQMHLQ